MGMQWEFIALLSSVEENLYFICIISISNTISGGTTKSFSSGF